MSDTFLVTTALLLVFMIFSLLRAMLGPTPADRAVALDTINTLVVAAMIVGGAAFNEPIYVDVAIVYALLSFITTLYIANHLEGEGE
ncbi:MAG TPA: cation:proton antiporter [Thermoplasmata archaeon]|nr:cation:proton antiporter [Thermoplasmata archaeon]